MSDIRARSFGVAAQRYERYRHGYPAEVANLVLGGLGDPSALAAVEVGAGTGKATRVFASRGVRVTAVEPDPAMAAVLERVCAGLPVEVASAGFEELDHPAGSVDVVYAAAAWHWVDPVIRWVRSARLLRTGGVVAAITGPVEPADPDLAERLREFDRRFVDTTSVWGDDGTADPAELSWPGDELVASPYFCDVEEHHLVVRSSMTAEDMVGLISTVSSYLVLDEETRTRLLGEIHAMLPDLVHTTRDLTIHRAVRNDTPVD